MRAVGQADRSGGARNLFHRDAMLEIAEPRPAPFLVHRDAEQTELAELRPQIARERVAFVDLGGARRDAVLRKSADAVAQHVDVGAETETEPRPAIWNHGLPPLDGLRSPGSIRG